MTKSWRIWRLTWWPTWWRRFLLKTLLMWLWRLLILFGNDVRGGAGRHGGWQRCWWSGWDGFEMDINLWKWMTWMKMHNCGWIFLQFPVRWSKVELQPGRKPVFHSKSTFWPQSCSWVMFQSRFLPFWWRCMFCICLLCEHRTWLGILLCLHWTLGRGSGTGVHLIHLLLVGMGPSLTLCSHPPNPPYLAHFYLDLYYTD